MPDDPYKYFRIEAHELLGDLTKGVLDLDNGAPAARAAAGVLRHAHTLKGAARVMKQVEIADHAHAIEEALDPFRESIEALPGEQLEAILGLLDAIRARLEALPLPDAVPGAPPERPGGDDSVRTIRTDIAEMDVLLDTVGEAHVKLSTLRTDIQNFERARGLADLVVSQLATSRGIRLGRHESGRRAERAALAAGELRTAITTFEQRLKHDVGQLDRELGEIRETVERLRLVPARSLFTDLERVARDVAQTQGKRVVFEPRGGDVRLDAHVLAAAHAALQQIVRNAVAHGIEPESERRASRKPPTGHVTLEIERRGQRVVFTCHDDGRGIDLDAVKEAARRQGLLPRDPEDIDSGELMRVLLRGGISTSSAVTELSGRGIGFDVVRDSAERLGGEITVTSEPGKGTAVELDAPLSLASFDVLAVEADGVRALIPLSAILQTLRVPAEEITANSHGEVLAYDGTIVPFLRLAETLHENATPQASGMWSVVITRSESGVAALGVQRILGSSLVVVRPLPGFVEGSAVVSGISLDAEGNPELVLDPDGLVVAAQRNRGRPPLAAVEPPSPILVVDDSLTTRMLEQSILESASYSVEVASSGEEALVKAQSKHYLLFLVDVEMPGMDGFTFIEQTKADPALRDIPSILVTSRSAPEDLQRGFEAGASAYVTKGEFDQGKLLERIKTLVR